MLRSVSVENYKSFRKGVLPLSPLTVMIGANASGKSNIIEAIRLLAWIAEGNRLGTIRNIVSDDDKAVRGTTKNLPRRGTKAFIIHANLSPVENYSNYCAALLVSKDDGDLHLVEETITGPDKKVPLFEVVTPPEHGGSDIRVAYDNFAPGGKKPQVTCTDQMSIMVQLMSSARFGVSHKASQTIIPKVCSAFQDDLTNTLFLDPQPARMRDYSFKSEKRLLGNGGNLSGVLYNLCQSDDGEFSILELIRSLPEQDINGIDFVETPRGEVMIKLKETFGDKERSYDATLLSDGTLRVLSIAAAILSAPEGSLVVIEEVDNGIHPSRAKQLLERMLAIAEDRKLQLLLSSHNPALLDALPLRAVPNVVFCYRDPKDGSSALIKLDQIRYYPELIAQGTVGHLMTEGIIDRFVKRSPDPEEKKKKSLIWLESLRKASQG